MNKKKIIFFSTGRSDFYLLSIILKEFKKSNKFKTYLVATGNHYEKTKGETFKEILRKGFKIDFKVPYNLKKSRNSEIINEISKSFIKNSKILKKLKPDIVLILGDRFELIPIAYSALLLNIPIAHLHGGEVTQGAFDDSIRHSVSKMSNLHFVCNQIYRKRLINMGEEPKNVHDVGGIGAELISREKKLKKAEVEKILNFKIDKKIILVSLHPETKNKNVKYFLLFDALKKIKKNFIIIFTSPNSDPGGHKILKEITKFTKNKNCYYISNLGSELYHSLLRISNLLIGNSSSGLLEAPLLNVPSVNIGQRQKGRLIERTVLNCKFNEKEILKSISIALKRKNKKNKIKHHKNKRASKKIFNIISKVDVDKIKVKNFFDVS